MPDGKLVIETELGTKNFDAQVQKLQRRLDDINATLEANNTGTWKLQENEIIDLRAEAEKLENQILDIQNRVEQAGKKDKKFGDDMSKSFKKLANNLKRLALNMLSVGSLLAVVSKASSSYLQQDTALAQKLQSVWVGLGSFLAPAIKAISDALLTGLGYLNEFIKALTDVDYIARANAKALDQQAKSQKNLNNQTYDFDVIRKQQSSVSSTNSAGSGLIELPELNNEVIYKLQTLAKWLKENWYWIKEIGIVLGVTFGAVKIAGLLKNISTLIGYGGATAGAGAGLAGLLPLLIALASVWTIKLYLEGYKQIKQSLSELKQMQDNLRKGLESYIKLTNELAFLSTQTNKENVAIENALTAGKEFAELGKSDASKIKSIVSWNAYKGNIENNALALKTNLDVLQQLSYAMTSEQYETYQELLQMYKKLNALIEGGYWKTPTTLKGFARGGIVSQPTRALIGEAGYPEAVVPMNADYLGTLAQAIAQYGGGGNSTTNVYLDGRLIQRQQNKVTRNKQFATNS